MKKDRRSLVEGLNETSELKQIEKVFVYGDSPSEDNRPMASENTTSRGNSTAAQPNRILPQMEGRIPVTVRCRPEIASAIKRVSLQRQLDGVEPYFVQDITEQALENWLKDRGYL